MKNFAKELGKNMAMVMGVELFKDVFNVVKSINNSTIIMNENDNGFIKLNELLYKIDPNKYSKFRVPTTDVEVFQLSQGANYIIRFNNNTYAHVVSEYIESKVNTPYKNIIIRFYGKDKFKYRKKFLRYVALDKSNKHIEIIPTGSRSYYNSNKLLTISFNDIILNKSIKDQLINGLKNWKDDYRWYYDNGMVHKIGVLLYGKPGTGKSTVVRCISNMFKNPAILVVNGSDVKASAMEIIYRRKSIPQSETLIVLLEDFDMFFNNREDVRNKDNNETNVSKDENMNALFQMLDGVYSTQNTIYIATTNYIDRIDPALIRTGRFDIQIELSYFSKKDSIEYIRKLGMDVSILDTLDLEFPIKPSSLRNRILEYKSQKYINGGN